MSAFMASNAPITVGGQKMTVREAVASGDSRLINAALAQGRYQFIRDNGLNRVSKKQFVKLLGPTILQSDAAMSTRIASEVIEQRRKQTKETLKGQAYALAQSSTDAETTWRESATLAWQSGAYTTRGEANEAALDGVIAGLQDKGDVDGLRQLLVTEKVKGNKGTQLRYQYGQKINEAIRQAQKREDEIADEALDEIEDDLYRNLATLDPQDPATKGVRDRMIEDAAKKLEAGGFYREARELRSDRIVLLPTLLNN